MSNDNYETYIEQRCEALNNDRGSFPTYKEWLERNKKLANLWDELNNAK